jgi:hypothetical protein
MAGYSGYSKSNNALKAEREGKFPKTIAQKVLREVLLNVFSVKITTKEAKEILEKSVPCEWHHTSKNYNATDYYCIGDIILILADDYFDDSDICNAITDFEFEQLSSEAIELIRNRIKGKING